MVHMQCTFEGQNVSMGPEVNMSKNQVFLGKNKNNSRLIYENDSKMGHLGKNSFIYILYIGAQIF